MSAKNVKIPNGDDAGDGATTGTTTGDFAGKADGIFVVGTGHVPQSVHGKVSVVPQTEQTSSQQSPASKQI